MLVWKSTVPSRSLALMTLHEQAGLRGPVYYSCWYAASLPATIEQIWCATLRPLLAAECLMQQTCGSVRPEAESASESEATTSTRFVSCFAARTFWVNGAPGAFRPCMNMSRVRCNKHNGIALPSSAAARAVTLGLHCIPAGNIYHIVKLV